MNSIQVPLTFSEHHSGHYHLQPKVSKQTHLWLTYQATLLKHIGGTNTKDIIRLFKMQSDSQYLLDSNSL